ncbi:MAG: hypothetical protein WC707_02855 [Candidatus Babeliaceae bacterium]
MIRKLIIVCCFSGNCLFGMSDFDALPSEIIYLIAGNLLQISVDNKNGKTYFVGDVPSQSGTPKKIDICTDIMHFGATSKKHNVIAQVLMEQKFGMSQSKFLINMIDILAQKFFDNQPHVSLYIAANIRGPGIYWVRDYLKKNKKAYANHELRSAVLTQAFCRGVLDGGDNNWHLIDERKRKMIDVRYCRKVMTIEKAYPELAQDLRDFYDHSVENNEMPLHVDNRHRRS